MSKCICQPGSIQVCAHCAREDAYNQQRTNVKNGRTPDDQYDLHVGNVNHFNKMFDQIFKPTQSGATK